MLQLMVIVSAISQKSDYLAVAGGGSVSTYGFTGTTTVNIYC